MKVLCEYGCKEEVNGTGEEVMNRVYCSLCKWYKCDISFSDEVKKRAKDTGKLFYTFPGSDYFVLKRCTADFNKVEFMAIENWEKGEIIYEYLRCPNEINKDGNCKYFI